MTSIERFRLRAAAGCSGVLRSTSVFVRDVGHGLLEVGHNSFALVGFVLVGITLFGAGQSDLRHQFEARTLGWLQARQEARLAPVAAPDEATPVAEPDAIARATATDPKELNHQQAAVALWLSRRYKVAPEPVSRLVQEAWLVGARSGLDPTLILAIMAVESSFNPFAQSSVGAQGLMQVMTKVHDAKYEAFGGSLAAFDPVTNLRVGVQVLKECIARAGSVEAGLRFYVGAANLVDDGGYAGKVLNEQSNLRLVASGKRVLPSVMMTVSMPRPRPSVGVPGESVQPTTPAPDAATPAPAAAAPAPSSEQIALLH